MRDEDDRLEVVTRWGGADQPAGSWLVEAGAAGKRGGDSRSSPREPVFREGDAGSGALAALPLVVRRGPARAALARVPGRARVHREDRAFLAACAGQCGQALERAQLHERTAVAAAGRRSTRGRARRSTRCRGSPSARSASLELVVEHLGGLAWIELREDDERLLAVAAADREGTPGDELLSRPREARLSAVAAQRGGGRARQR